VGSHGSVAVLTTTTTVAAVVVPILVVVAVITVVEGCCRCSCQAGEAAPRAHDSGAGVVLLE
jgi:hypothetical protein